MNTWVSKVSNRLEDNKYYGEKKKYNKDQGIESAGGDRKEVRAAIQRNGGQGGIGKTAFVLLKGGASL